MTYPCIHERKEYKVVGFDEEKNFHILQDENGTQLYVDLMIDDIHDEIKKCDPIDKTIIIEGLQAYTSIAIRPRYKRDEEKSQNLRDKESR